MRVVVANAPPRTVLLPALVATGASRLQERWRSRRRQRHLQTQPQAEDWWLPPRATASDEAAAAELAADKEQPLPQQQPAQEQLGSGSGGEAEEWQQAQHAIQAQQAAGLAAPYPLDQTRQLVETAMLAAVTALSYTVGHLLKVEAYLAYMLPLPVVLAALRSGPLPALKTLTTAVLLLLILMGPVRAVTYLLVYGVLSLMLGACWSWRLPWALSVPLGALARIAGYLAYIALSSWVTNENLLMLMLTNIYSLLDQLSAVLGTTGSPPLLAVVVVLCSLLFVNSLMYVALMHVLYAIVLRSMGLTLHRLPRFAERLVGQLPAT